MLVDSILGRVIRTIGIFYIYLDNVIIVADSLKNSVKTFAISLRRIFI